MIFYDLTNGTRSQILHDWEIYDFSLSTSNRLAFSSSHEGSNNIYILDFPFSDKKPMKISINPASDFVRLSWSPDGHYLLFDSTQGDVKKLVIWDGETISEIYKYHESASEFALSPNGYLAFTDFYTFIFPHGGDTSEIFMWDGTSIINVSQNPSGEDRYPAWSKGGKLAFLSERDENYDIFVWDGESKINGLPDTNTFINIAPDKTYYFSNLTWTNTETIAFEGGESSISGIQIYEWDGQSAINMSRNPLDNNGGQTWRNDGYWSFVTYFSDTQNLFIRDEKNRTVLKTKGQYQPAWSQSGTLLFCVNNHPSWTLAIWYNNEIIEIVTGDSILAKWPNGNEVWCSNG